MTCEVYPIEIESPMIRTLGKSLPEVRSSAKTIKEKRKLRIISNRSDFMKVNAL